MKVKKKADEVPQEPQSNQISRLFDAIKENRWWIAGGLGLILSTGYGVHILLGYADKIDELWERSDGCLPFNELPAEIQATVLYELDENNIIPQMLSKYDCDQLQSHLKKVKTVIELNGCNDDGK